MLNVRETNKIKLKSELVRSNDQFLALTKPTNFIVKGQLTLDADVTEAVLLEKIAALE
ncbi:hypothetical protein RJD24_09225 [Bacillaceae bacterium IKA-2]|nr:hypothetical protein RJD24_09225 [Bacillaceae bacterium IKA-2]